MQKCEHEWKVAGGGEPVYKTNPSSSVRTDEPVVQVECTKCGAQTWLTKEQFEGVSEEVDGDDDENTTDADSEGSDEETGSDDDTSSEGTDDTGDGEDATGDGEGDGSDEVSSEGA